MRIGRLIFALALCVASTGVSAKVVAFVGDTRAERILLHSTRGLCTVKALRAQFVDKKGRYTEGCWKVVDEGNIQVVFLDGDVVRVPMSAFKKPEEI